MKKYNFNNSEQMYNFLSADKDLYNPTLGIYLWSYNIDGAIAYANIDREWAKELALSHQDNEYWGNELGGKSYIIESEEASKYENESPELFKANKKAVCEYLDSLLQKNKDWYKADVSYLDKTVKNILLNNTMECELLFTKNNYALIRRDDTTYDPYVIAYAPQIANGQIEWGQGHYIQSYNDALKLFNEKVNEINMQDNKTVFAIYDFYENPKGDIIATASTKEEAEEKASVFREETDGECDLEIKQIKCKDNSKPKPKLVSKQKEKTGKDFSR